jgi:hypothetical protein
VDGLLGLVDRHPHPDVIAEGVGDHGRVFRKPLRGVAAGPPALVLQGLGELPVIEGRHRDDVAPAQLLDERSVVVQTGLIDGTAPGRLHTGPRDRESVRADAELGQKPEIGIHAVIGVAGDVAGVPVVHPARGVAEDIPD